MTEPTISRVALLLAWRERLSGLPDTEVYPGEVPADPPVMVTDDGPDPAGRVGRYVVLYPGPGRPGSDRDLAGAIADLTAPVQLTVVAGYLTDCLDLVDDVVPLIEGWSPSLPGLGVGHYQVPDGYDPGPVRRDDTKRPPRFWVALQYRLDITT